MHVSCYRTPTKIFEILFIFQIRYQSKVYFLRFQTFFFVRFHISPAHKLASALWKKLLEKKNMFYWNFNLKFFFLLYQYSCELFISFYLEFFFVEISRHTKPVDSLISLLCFMPLHFWFTFSLTGWYCGHYSLVF